MQCLPNHHHIHCLITSRSITISRHTTTILRQKRRRSITLMILCLKSSTTQHLASWMTQQTQTRNMSYQTQSLQPPSKLRSVSALSHKRMQFPLCRHGCTSTRTTWMKPCTRKAGERRCLIQSVEAAGLQRGQSAAKTVLVGNYGVGSTL